MRKIYIIFGILFLMMVLPLTLFTLEKQQTHYRQQAAGNPPQFFGVNVDICLLNPNSPNYVKNSHGQDLIDIAGHLGITFFRINDGGCGLSGGPISAGNWGLVLNKMATYNIQAQIVSGMGGGFGTGSITYAVSKVINNKLGSYPNVYGYDLVNEPYIDPPTIAAMLQAKQQIQAVYPNLRITVGGWKTLHGVYNCPATFTGTCWQLPQDGQYLYPVVDYFSPHIYGFDKPLNGPYKDAYTLITNYFDQMLTYTQGKPIIVGEYGASNGYELTDIGTLASPQLQANVTDAMLRAVQAYQSRNVLGSAQWAFYNRSLTRGGTPGWDLVYNNGTTILPAAYVIQKYSTGTSDIPLTLPMPIISKDYIFTNTDNGKTVAINQNDIIGLDLTLPSASYSLQVSTPSFFTITESLVLGTDGNYKNVLHAANPGTATVSIISNNCSSNCQVFQMTFTINSGNGPTPAPTSQPSVLFSISVCPHGLGNCGDNANSNSRGNNNPLHSTRNITLRLIDTNNNLVPGSPFQGQVTYVSSLQNFQGILSFPNIPNGQYLAIIKMDGYLGKQIPGVITVTQGQQITLPLVYLVAGDINNDNQLDISDYNILVSCFGSKINTSSCPLQYKPNQSSPGADIFDDDGQVDGGDYNLFLRELSVQSGDTGGTTPTP